MRPLSRFAFAAILLAAAGFAWPSETNSACASEPGAQGLAQRLDNLRQQMSRIEAAEGPQQRRLMDLHLKAMQEGLHELRSRGVSEPCRVEMMHAVMEQLLRHQLAAQGLPDR